MSRVSASNIPEWSTPSAIIVEVPAGPPRLAELCPTDRRRRVQHRGRVLREVHQPDRAGRARDLPRHSIRLGAREHCTRFALLCRAGFCDPSDPRPLPSHNATRPCPECVRLAARRPPPAISFVLTVSSHSHRHSSVHRPPSHVPRCAAGSLAHLCGGGGIVLALASAHAVVLRRSSTRSLACRTTPTLRSAAGRSCLPLGFPQSTPIVRRQPTPAPAHAGPQCPQSVLAGLTRVMQPPRVRSRPACCRMIAHSG